MDNIYYSVIASLIFASDEPIAAADLIKAVKGLDGDEIKISSEEIEEAVEKLNEVYDLDIHPFRIIKIAEKFTFATKPEYAKYLGYLSSERSKRRLSQSAVETLSIIAYKQPITKPELEAIRGVNCDYIINTLMEKKLITMTGRAETMGRPLLYVTTEDFLRYFGLNKISDLPKPREIDEIMKDEDFLEQKRKIMMNQLEEVLEKENNNGEDDGA